MNVLILCTGNSCRSQMAEGFLQRASPDWVVRSAGTEPSPEVHPIAIQVMADNKIDLSGHRPESVDLYLGQEWDLVWTVCGGARESCPRFSGKVKQQIHIGFDDPAGFSGTEAEVRGRFRQVRDEIEAVCLRMARQYKSGAMS